MYLKTNPKAFRLGALFKHIFQKVKDRILTELVYWISRIHDIIELTLPYNLESGNRKL